jgi:hypothetical protein
LKELFVPIDGTIPEIHFCNHLATCLLALLALFALSKDAKMFANKIDALRGLVVQRELVLHQKRLDNRRWSVRRDILRDAKDSFLPALEAAIAKSHNDYGHTVLLRTYSVADWEEADGDGITLCEVLEKTDVLQRVANCLAPGFFKCHVRPANVHGRPAVPHVVRVYQVIARFYAGGVEAAKPPCTCVCSHLTDGFCGVCGGHNVRQINNPEDEEEVS